MFSFSFFTVNLSKAFSSQEEQREQREVCVMAYTIATLFTMCISSQRQIQIHYFKKTGTVLWSFARFVMLLYASSVTSLSSEWKQGQKFTQQQTIICCAS